MITLLILKQGLNSSKEGRLFLFLHLPLMFYLKNNNIWIHTMEKHAKKLSQKNCIADYIKHKLSSEFGQWKPSRYVVANFHARNRTNHGRQGGVFLEWADRLRDDEQVV